MERFVLDANIFLGLLNKKDLHHQKCFDFFQDIDRRRRSGETKLQAVIPLHLAVEVNINIRRKKRAGEWENFPNFTAGGQENYPIDLQFIKRVGEEALYDKFDKLRPPDAIYGMIAYLEKIPVVTLDNDFKKVQDIIDVVFI